MNTNLNKPMPPTAQDGSTLGPVGAEMSMRHRYDLALVKEAMDDLRERGIKHQFVNIVVLNSEGWVIPEYVQALLNTGATWDDPRIYNAFADLLDRFVPLMLDRGMFVLALSNDPSGYYEDARAQAASFKGFIRAAVAHAHRIEPDLACTVVFAGSADPAIGDLMPLLDAASFNSFAYAKRPSPRCTHGGTSLPPYRSDAAEQVGTQLDKLIAVAQGKLINIQKIGQATEGASLGELTGEANQAAVYDALGTALRARREEGFRILCNWTLNNHDRAWNPLRAILVREGLPACYANNIRDMFTKTGLVHSDRAATAKPALFVFKRSISAFAGVLGD